MNIIAVDDEKYLLKDIEKAIREAVTSATVKGFRKPKDALEVAKGNNIDVAFLDIKMIGMTGLELAKKLKDINGNTNIIFVTGYSEYAIDSYSIPASGYILKPVTKEAVLEAMKNLRNPVELKSQKKIKVQCFGNFEVFCDGKPLYFSRAKAKEVFAYLIDRQGAFVTTAEIASVIWEVRTYKKNLPDQIRVIISSLQKTLRENCAENIIIRKHNQIAINKEKIQCDYYEFLKMNASAVNTYTGEYMSNYSWAEITAGYMQNRSK
ncbi:MAG: response regulator [Treponema sp.]|nr:response regulator [Treponema sp.]